MFIFDLAERGRLLKNPRKIISLSIASLMVVVQSSAAIASGGVYPPPNTFTLSVSGVTGSSAHLYGSGPYSSLSSVGFEYGKSTSYGSMASTSPATGDRVLTDQFGQAGSGDGEFSHTSGITHDSDGNTYVVDSDQGRVQKFNRSGSFVTKWGSFATSYAESVTGKFDGATDIAFSPSDGLLYVADAFSVKKFDTSGNFISQWGVTNFGPTGAIFGASGIAVSSVGNVYVVDQNDVVSQFSSSGTLIRTWGSTGSGVGQFQGSTVRLAIDSQGNVYVGDLARVQKFSATGVAIGVFGDTGSGDELLTGAIEGIATDDEDNFYVIERSSGYVKGYTSAGAYKGKFGVNGGGFSSPRAIGVDAYNNVYVGDITDDTVYRLGSSFDIVVNPLECSTTYHFRAFTSGGNGIGYGEDQTFTTGNTNCVTVDDNIDPSIIKPPRTGSAIVVAIVLTSILGGSLSGGIYLVRRRSRGSLSRR